MEILKGFVFDLQRHTWTDGTSTLTSIATIKVTDLPTSNDTTDTDAHDIYYTSGSKLSTTSQGTSAVVIGTIKGDDTNGYVLTLSDATVTGLDLNAATKTYSVTSSESNLALSNTAGTGTGTAILTKGSTVKVAAATGNTIELTELAETSGVTVTSTAGVSLGLNTANETTIGYGTQTKTIVVKGSVGGTLTLTSTGAVTMSTGSTMTFKTSEELPIATGSNGTWKLNGTAKIAEASGVVTELATGSKILNNTKAVSTAGVGSFTVCGVGFTTIAASSVAVADRTVTVTPNASPATKLTIATHTLGTGETFEVTSDNNPNIQIGASADNTFNNVSKGVVITGHTTDDTACYATLAKNGDTVTFNGKKVKLLSGNVNVTAAGELNDLKTGESVEVAGYTISIANNKDGKAIISVTTEGGTTKTYQFATVAGVTASELKLDLSNGVSASDLSDLTQTETEVEAYSPDTIYASLGDRGTAKLVSTLENTGKLEFTSDGKATGTKYATLTKNTDTSYTLTYTTQAQTLTNGVTIDSSALPTTAVLAVATAGCPDTTKYETSGATMQIGAAAKNFTLTGDAVNFTDAEGTRALTLTDGTVTLENINGVDVTTSIGTLTVTDAITTATKVSSSGVVSGIDNGGIVTLQKDGEAAETDTVTFSVNGKAFTAVSEKGATIENADGTLVLSDGSLLVSEGTVNLSTTKSVKVTGGDGVIVPADGKLSDLENGEVVTYIDTSAATTKKYVYTVTNGVLEVASYTNADDTTPAGTDYYTLTGDSISLSGVGEPKQGEYETPTAVTATLGTTSSPAATTRVSDGVPLYIQRDGSTSLVNGSKTVGTLTVANDTATYEAASGAKGQTTTITDVAENNALNWNITTTSNADTITYAAKSDATINAGAGKDVIKVNTQNKAADIQVNAGDGNNEITLNSTATVNVNMGNGKNTVEAGGNGEFNITMGSGNNTVTHTGQNGNATIVGGTGKDTIEAAGLDDVVSGGDGADTFNVSQKSMTISDYVYGTDVLQAVTTSGGVAVTPGNFGADGVVTIAGSVVADVSTGTNTGDYYAVSLVDKDGKNKQNVAWAKEGGSTIDISTYDQAATLIGNADGKNALYAGTKADDIYSYADNDSVYGGAGKDYISLASGAAGRVVGVATTGGKDTVDGFKTGFEEGDSIFMIDGSASTVDVSYEGGNVIFKDGEGSLQLNAVTPNSTTGAVEINVSGTKVALAAASVGGAIAADSTSYADVYMGNDTALSFAAAEGEVNVDLRNGLDSGAAGAKYVGITSLTGGAGNNTLIGAAAGETLTAGTGASSIWGGAGKDTLVGGSASDVFYIGTGDGSDVVTNFSAAGNENADTVYTFSNITAAKLTNNGVEISVSDTDKITLKNVKADTAIKFNAGGNAGIAKVGSVSGANNFTYDSTVTYYGGGNKSDKIAFASGYTDNAEIWMNGIQGKSYASIDVVDGTNTSGSLIVAGDSASQSIIGGKGDTSLWGGAGSATDTLKSSASGKTMFWWGAGDGNDVVVSASADDSVNLYNVKLSDINSANSSITNSGVVLALNDGSKLTMQTSRGMTFSIEGQSWTADQSSKEWKQNS